MRRVGDEKVKFSALKKTQLPSCLRATVETRSPPALVVIEIEADVGTFVIPYRHCNKVTDIAKP